MNPLSKTKIKYIKSLQLKKYRLQEDKFIVEGKKSVLEFLASNYTVDEVIGTEVFFDDTRDIHMPKTLSIAKEKDLANLGSFKSNKEALAIVEIRHLPEFEFPANEVVLALDSINDPGNLGTIIRIADWYGIANVLLSKDSVDIYNPKVVSATKGSLTRVNMHYTDLSIRLKNYKGEVYAAYLNGISLNKLEPIKEGLILMGSESHGIDNTLAPFVDHKLTISGRGGAESLNVAVATGIICNHLVG